MEILITLGIIALALYIIYKSVRKSSKGGCNCNSCSSNCPMHKDEKLKIK